MLRAVIDTHAIVWYLYGDSRLSATALAFIEDTAATGNQLALSTMTLAEIFYLSERGRINLEAFDRLVTEMASDQALIVEIPFNRAVVLAFKDVARDIVPELPDRVITATAVYLKLSVISRDHKIQASGISTIW